jgi:hypothetical protein
MPAGVLKLDMSFIVDLNPENNTGKIVAAIINMAHALQKQVVAEGIERPEQLALLKELGCDRGQGYLLGRPASADDLVRNFSQKRDFTQPSATIPAAAEWRLPPMPMAPAAPAPRPAAKPAPGAGPRPAAIPAKPAAAAPKPAQSQDDYWNNDLLEEALTVPRFFEEDFISPS